MDWSCGQFDFTFIPSSSSCARARFSKSKSICTSPSFLPLFVSGRSVLVAIGVGYIIFYLHENRSHLKLWLGVLLIDLSSTLVFISLLLLIFGTGFGMSEVRLKRIVSTQ